MDATDLAIVRELIRTGPQLATLPAGDRRSVSALARSLGLPETTVRRRFRSMRETGFIRAIRVVPNPNLLDLEWGAFGLTVASGDQKEAVAETIAAAEGVLIVQEHYRPQMGVICVSRGGRDLDRTRTLLSRFAIDGSVVYTPLPFPPVEFTPTASEWSLLAHLVNHGSQPYSAIGRRLGISSRTVLRGLDRLTQCGGIFLLPYLDFSTLRGGVPADLILSLDEAGPAAEAEARVLSLLSPYLLHAGRWGPRLSVHTIVLPNAVAASGLERTIRSIDGVEAAQLELVLRRIEPAGKLADYHLQAIAERRRSLSRSSHTEDRTTCTAPGSLMPARLG